MSFEIIYQQNEFLIIAVLFALLLCAAEAEFRRGRKVALGLTENAKSELSTLQGGVMGLLALLLAFTFAMAVSRFDTRMQLVVEEANAIGTMTLRSKMLAEPASSTIPELVRRYLNYRLQFYDANASEPQINSDVADEAAIQTTLWSLAIAAVKADPHSIPYGLFISSLNEVIDIQAKRDAASRNHVPESVLLLLFVVAIFTMALIGLGCGYGNHRNFGAMVAISIVISLVILIIIDLDRPRRGIIRVPQQALLSLLNGLPSPKPHP